MHPDFETRLQAFERSQRRLRSWVYLLAASLAAAIAALALQPGAVSASATAPVAGPLRVTELVVVDPQGVERVRIGGDLPDAVIDGRRVPRGSKAAGVMLYDRSGQERGGYVTWNESDNIGLTLDGRKGQNALFVAGPDGSTALQLWQGGQLVELRADGNGARLTHTRNGAITLQQPEIARLSEATCTLFRGGLREEVPGGLPVEKIRQICQGRFSTTACNACLDGDGTATAR